MKRRDFIRNSALASTWAFVPGFLKPFESLGAYKGKRLVVIELSGGNDWLNCIVPYKNDLYFKTRPSLALGTDMLVPLEKDMALNRSLIALKDLYDNGELAIVNDVGYPNPDRSHFRSMDIWHTASSANEYFQTGWIGRYLDSECEQAMKAVQLDNYLSLALKGKRLNGIATTDIDRLHKEFKNAYFNKIVELAKKEALQSDNRDYMYKMLINTDSGIDHLKEKFNRSTGSADYPNTSFGKQLKNISTLIGNGCEATVYYLNLTGFDTHANQLARHNELQVQYAEGVSSFTNDLKKQGTWDGTLIFTFSEFGRRVEENASKGTDHGAAGNVLLMGKQLKKKGIVNQNPDLSDLTDGDLKYSVDFRRVYSNILESWLNTDPVKIIPGVHDPYIIV